MGDVGGGIDEEVTAIDQTSQSEGYPEEVPAEMRVVFRQFGIIFEFFFRRHQAVFLGGVESVDHKAEEAEEQDNTVGTGDFVAPEVRRVHIVETENEEQQRGDDGKGNVLADGGLLHHHRRH